MLRDGTPRLLSMRLLFIELPTKKNAAPALNRGPQSANWSRLEAGTADNTYLPSISLRRSQLEVWSMMITTTIVMTMM